MTTNKKHEHLMDINNRFQSLLKNAQSIVNTSHPFYNMVAASPDVIFETMNIYKKFDMMRNSVPNEDQIQKKFEDFLKNGEEMIESIRKVTDTIIDTEKLHEGKNEEITKVLGEQIKKYKNWLKNSMKNMENDSEDIKKHFSVIEMHVKNEISKMIQF